MPNLVRAKGPYSQKCRKSEGAQLKVVPDITVQCDAGLCIYVSISQTSAAGPGIGAAARAYDWPAEFPGHQTAVKAQR